MSVEEDLADLEAVLASNRVVAFPDSRRPGSLVRSPLARFTGHIYLFPVGLQPEMKEPVEVYLNGVGPQFLGDDVRLVQVGAQNTVAVVFDVDLSVEDTVQARFVLAGGS